MTCYVKMEVERPGGSAAPSMTNHLATLFLRVAARSAQLRPEDDAQSMKDTACKTHGHSTDFQPPKTLMTQHYARSVSSSALPSASSCVSVRRTAASTGALGQAASAALDARRRASSQLPPPRAAREALPGATFC